MDAPSWIALGMLAMVVITALVGHVLWDARMFSKHGERLATLEAHAAKCKCHE